MLAVPTNEALKTVSHKIFARPMTRLSRWCALVEQQGSTYMADNYGDPDDGRGQVEASSATWYDP